MSTHSTPREMVELAQAFFLNSRPNGRRPGKNSGKNVVLVVVDGFGHGLGDAILSFFFLFPPEFFDIGFLELDTPVVSKDKGREFRPVFAIKVGTFSALLDGLLWFLSLFLLRVVVVVVVGQWRNSGSLSLADRLFLVRRSAFDYHRSSV